MYRVRAGNGWQQRNSREHDLIVLRAVSEVDSLLLLEWRNDVETRRASRSDRIVPYEEHNSWFRKGLNSAHRIMKIAEENGEPVGVVRADRTDEGWELSWMVAPKSRGRGIGEEMLKLFAAELEGPLMASIHRGNRASIKMAQAAGFYCLEGQAKGMFDTWLRDMGLADR